MEPSGAIRQSSRSAPPRSQTAPPAARLTSAAHQPSASTCQLASNPARAVNPITSAVTTIVVNALDHAAYIRSIIDPCLKLVRTSFHAQVKYAQKSPFHQIGSTTCVEGG